MEIEHETQITTEVKCPHCGKSFEATIAGTCVVWYEPEERDED